MSLAYTDTGGWAPLLVPSSGLIFNIAVEQQVRAAAEWYARIGESRRIIRFEGRGIGLSGGSIEYNPGALWVSDVVTVLDAARVDTVDLVAVLPAADVALNLAISHPARVGRIMLFNPILVSELLRSHVTKGLLSLGRGSRDLYIDTLARTLVGEDSQEYATVLQSSISEVDFAG